ncbi:acyltransferase family protein [Rathayibacter tanaceti]|uniref:Acyltransferase family protein n=2 Tax=Rathayibacter tanaceti TaxID=1671680 RepID=A0A166HDZ1_9MICO|nr:acyltransferase family protein [Rathayibacter tanaceti]KZX20431.1 Inner membrane protein YcfT [Rathayibacter tanaceti]QHC55751.1 acyltransferase family protein [Rathayibacter tanaceti]TCO39434.1 putative membrane protein YcfT [Rathayibacter tanaceti]
MQHWPIASATVVAGRLMTDDYGRGFMARARITWVDTAKGIAIVLVALAHSVQWTTTAGLAPDAWNDINLLLITFRMPLFFLASGLFAGSVLSRTWPELWRSRLSLLVWTFLLWSVVRFVFFLVVPNPGGTDESDPVALLLQPVMPHNGLWFLYALTIFFVLAKLARGRVDWRVQIGLATAIAVVWYAVRSTTSEGTGNIAWDGMARYLMFFLLGLHLRSAVIAFVERRGIVSGLGFGVLFLVLAGGILAVRGRFPLLTVGLVVVSVLAVLAGLIVARFLSDRRGARWITFIGRNTLPVYVVHVLFVSLATSALLLFEGQRWLDAIAPAVPLVVCAVGVAAALGYWRLTRDLPVLAYGFRAPRWFAGTTSRLGAR